MGGAMYIRSLPVRSRGTKAPNVRSSLFDEKNTIIICGMCNHAQWYGAQLVDNDGFDSYLPGNV